MVEIPTPPFNEIESESVLETQGELDPDPEPELEPEPDCSFWGTERGPEPLESIYSRLRQKICPPKRLTSLWGKL